MVSEQHKGSAAKAGSLQAAAQSLQELALDEGILKREVARGSGHAIEDVKEPSLGGDIKIAGNSRHDGAPFQKQLTRVIAVWSGKTAKENREKCKKK
jgi:hypothetical protein